MRQLWKGPFDNQLVKECEDCVYQHRGDCNHEPNNYWASGGLQSSALYGACVSPSLDNQADNHVHYSGQHIHQFWSFQVYLLWIELG